jgi:hypothetical protein
MKTLILKWMSVSFRVAVEAVVLSAPHVRSTASTLGEEEERIWASDTSYTVFTEHARSRFHLEVLVQ